MQKGQPDLAREEFEKAAAATGDEEKLAAAELQEFIAKVSGAKLEIVTLPPDGKPTGPAVVLGARFARTLGFGTELDKYVQIAWPQASVGDGVVRGEVVYIDHFGNAITNIAAADIAKLARHAPSVFLRGEEVCAVKNYYQEVTSGEAVAVIGSSGFLEIAINGGHAVRALGVRLGEPVEVK